MKKNVAGQVVGAQLINASTGAAFTGSVTVFVTGDGGTQAQGSVGSGACTHEGNGFHTYAPAQAETNYDHVAFTFTGTGAIPVTVQVYTSFPQSGDGFARLGAPIAASISADIQVIDGVVDSILTDTAEIANLNDISTAEVNAEVVDALSTDTYAEPTGAPAATASLAAKINRLYMALRNGLTVTAAAKTFLDDDGNAEWVKALSDDGTTYTEGEADTP